MVEIPEFAAKLINRQRFDREAREDIERELMSRTLTQLKCFADKHDIPSIGMRGSKVIMTRCIIDWLEVQQYEPEIALAMVSCQSSYISKEEPWEQ